MTRLKVVLMGGLAATLQAGTVVDTNTIYTSDGITFKYNDQGAAYTWPTDIFVAITTVGLIAPPPWIPDGIDIIVPPVGPPAPPPVAPPPPIVPTCDGSLISQTLGICSPPVNPPPPVIPPEQCHPGGGTPPPPPPTPTPEPSSWIMAACGFVLVGIGRSRIGRK